MIQSSSATAIAQGMAYIQKMQGLVPEAGMIDVHQNLRDRTTIYPWMGQHIEAINAVLREYVLACHQCFHLSDRRAVQIFALPLASSWGLDGICNLATHPITLLVDVGRMTPNHWLSLVAHEYAHAHVAAPGHQQSFATALAHLCLGLGLEPPPQQTEALLRHWPPYPRRLDALAFWRGELGISFGPSQNE